LGGRSEKEGEMRGKNKRRKWKGGGLSKILLPRTDSKYLAVETPGSHGNLVCKTHAHVGEKGSWGGMKTSAPGKAHHGTNPVAWGVSFETMRDLRREGAGPRKKKALKAPSQRGKKRTGITIITG